MSSLWQRDWRAAFSKQNKHRAEKKQIKAITNIISREGAAVTTAE